MIRRFATVSVLGAVLASSALAQDQWPMDLPDGVDISPRQIFVINTRGKNRRDPEGPLLREAGTGFAIAPKVIITAKHVTMRAEQFVNDAGSDKIRIPNRTIELSYTADEGPDTEPDTNDTVWVTPSPVQTTDAARIDLVTMNAKPFDLSVCNLDDRTAETFYLLKFSQSENGTGKNMNLPTAVPLKIDKNIKVRQGNLRRFKLDRFLSAGDVEKPVPGDSGSPILDASGKVVGLLTAIQGDSLLWVTPTVSFYDLVPPEARHLADCNSEVTFDDLNNARDGLASSLTALEQQLAQTQAAFDTQIAAANSALDVQQQRIDALLGQLTALEADAVALAQVDKGLLATDDKLSDGLEDVDLLSTSLMTVMLLEADKRGLPRDALIQAIQEAAEKNKSAEIDDATAIAEKSRNLIDSMSSQFAKDPVGSAVNDMLAELSTPVWDIDVFEQGIDNPTIELAYTREIARPLVTRRMNFCLRPMFDFKPDVTIGERAENASLDYKSNAFYALSEAVLESERKHMTKCAENTYQPERSKSFAYTFEVDIDISRRFDPSDHDALNMDNPPQFFYGYAVDEDVVRGKKSGDTILHRMIFEVSREDDIAAIECYYFPQIDGSDPLDDLATFAQITDGEEKKAYKCQPDD